MTDQELVSSDNKVAYISMCSLLTYYDVTMLYTVETTDLFPLRKKNVIYGEIYFLFMIPGPYHFNYSLSFNPANVTLALLLERLKYIEPLI